MFIPRAADHWYIRLVHIAQVEASKKDIPPGFQMPKSEKDFMIAAPAEIEEDENL